MKQMEQVFRKLIQDGMTDSGISEEQFEFFWETKSPFSQWHKCSFNARPFFQMEAFSSEINFTSAEQYMMLNKALVFQDTETAKLIMSTTNVRDQKKFGRHVSGFEAAKWDSLKVKIVYEGNKEKFSQNSHLLEFLLATKGKTLVEAAPDDTIWGIGLSADDTRARQRETWNGTNFLGDVLTALRIDLSGTY